jgi:hypothetical protein
MTDHGFSKVPQTEVGANLTHAYFHRGAHLLVGDANNQNIKKTPYGLVPVDLIISHQPPGTALHEAAMRATAETAFPLGPGLQRGTEQVRGERAMWHAIRERIDVHGAMEHPLLGALDFRYGKAGDPAKHYADGHGIANVVAQYGPRVALRLPHVIAHGQLRQTPFGMEIHHAGHRVVLISKHPDGRHVNHWVAFGHPLHPHR